MKLALVLVAAATAAVIVIAAATTTAVVAASDDVSPSSGTCAKISHVLVSSNDDAGDKKKQQSKKVVVLPPSPFGTVVNAAVLHLRSKKTGNAGLSAMENTPCDLSCETQLCSCLGLQFDAAAMTAPASQQSLLGFCGAPVDPAAGIAAESGKFADCFASFKSCRETFMASPPEPQDDMVPCSGAIIAQGYHVSPESCALTACAFAANLDHLVTLHKNKKQQQPPALSSSSATETASVFSNAVDVSVACGADESRILQRLAAASAGGYARLARVLENTTTAATTRSGGATEDPKSSFFSAIVSFFKESMEGGKKTNAPTTAPRTTQAPAPTTPRPTAAPTTTTPQPTNAPPLKDDKVLLKPGEVQLTASNPATVTGDVNKYLETQKKYIASTLPNNFDIKFILYPVGSSTDQFEVKFVVTDSNGDKAAEARIEAAAAQMLSDAMNSKFVVNPALAQLKNPKGRVKRDSNAPYPTLPAPLNPPPPKMEELPVGAVVGGIVGGVVVGLLGGGAVAHFFCSKVETLPLADRILPTADDDDSDDEEEEEEEDEDGDDAAAAALDQEMAAVPVGRGASGSRGKSKNESGGGGAGAPNQFSRTNDDEMLGMLGVGSPTNRRGAQAAGGGAAAGGSGRRDDRGGGGGGGNNRSADRFSPRDGLAGSPSASARDLQRGGGGGSSRRSERGGGDQSGDRRPQSSGRSDRGRY